MHLEMAFEFGRKFCVELVYVRRRPFSRIHNALELRITPPRRDKEAGEDRGSLLPVLRLFFELFPSDPGELVELGLAVVLRRAPFGGDRALLFEFQQGGIERPVIEGDQFAAGLFDAPRDAVTVLRAHGFEGLQNHQRQCALPNIRFISHELLLLVAHRNSCTASMGMQ